MDWKKIGLTCGLEIHQQLATSKLFCSCPTTLREDKPDFTIQRELRAVQGESGEIDVAAMHEQQKEKHFLYEGYHSTTCLIECDEEPPQPMDGDALVVGLQVALLLNANVVDVIQVMRKTVVDGSNTSGFQRTALIAQDGKIKTAGGDVIIPTISLEEDAARIIKRSTENVVYRLDRLGIPLIEIGTNPDIYTPEQCKEVAQKLGMILRSTGKVKRGLGTIRQDVNVSIRGGNRVEIKGAQNLRMIPKIVRIEAARQLGLLKLAKELKKRKAKLKKNVVDVSAVLQKSSSSIIKNTFQKRGAVLGMNLSGFAGILNRELQLGRRLGTELSDHAKVSAGVGGIFHSDELPKYGISEKDVAAVLKKLKCGKQDAFVLVASNERRAAKALDAVFTRACIVLDGVPKEVRKANADGTTSYLRPMPGAARMYPETDIPLILPDIKGIKLPELLEAKIKRTVKKHKLSHDLAQHIVKSTRFDLFENLVKKYKNIKPGFIAEMTTGKLVELGKEHDVDLDKFTDNVIDSVFDVVDKGIVAKDEVGKALVDMANGKFNVKDFESGVKDVRKELEKIVKKHKGAPFGALMGIAVKALKGVSGKEISEKLKELLK